MVHTSTNSDSATLWLEHRREMPNPQRAARVFDSVVAGERQKVIAIDLGVAASTVAAMLRRVVEGMGLTCTFCRLPLPIALLRHAMARPRFVRLHWDAFGTSNDLPRLVLDIPRCDSSLAAKLTPSEYEVARQLIEGGSYQQIAAKRHASVRTIANQISSLYRKLNVTSRYGLLRSAVQAEAAMVPAPRPTADVASMFGFGSSRAGGTDLH